MKYTIKNKDYVQACKLCHRAKDLPKSAQVKRTPDNLGAWVGTNGFGWLYVSNDYVEFSKLKFSGT
jgi:hypothetical protein